MNLQDKKVLVTGGAGFIGSTLVRRLLKERADVIVLDNFRSGSLNNLKEVEKQITIINGTILDKNLDKIFKDNKVDFVFNLAALPYIPDSYKIPHEFFEVNSLGTLNVVMSAVKTGVKRVLQYSSSEVYGTAKQLPMNEDHPTLPHSTYAVSKLAADRVCFTLFHEKKAPVVILRQFNTYGPRETHPYIIPIAMSQLSKSSKINLGNIKARRDFVYVEDSADAAVRLIKHNGIDGQVFNCGSSKDCSIEFLVNKIGEIMGHKRIYIKVEKSRLRPLDVQVLGADYSKLNKVTGWNPKINIEEGLKMTYQWFIDNGRKWT